MNQYTSATWTTERLDVLRQMWDAGLSCSLIAERIGVTKNAVIGKAHRLGLAAHADRGNPSGTNQHARAHRKPTERRKRSQAPRVPAKVVSTAHNPFIGPGVTIQHLDRYHCRHIAGDPTWDAVYCGAPVKPGVVYCDHHHAQCWVPFVRNGATKPSYRP